MVYDGENGVSGFFANSKNATKILLKTPEGKQEARKLIKEYLDAERWKKFREQQDEDVREQEEQRRYPWGLAWTLYHRKRERFGLEWY